MIKRFSREYIFNSYVQERQNKKFLRFIFEVLDEFDVKGRLKRVGEIGVGDGQLLKEFLKVYRDKYSCDFEDIYLIDNNKEFLDIARRNFEKDGNRIFVILKDFREIEERDFSKGKVDIFLSSNTFHWFPFNEEDNSWLNAMEKVYNFLDEGGFFFLHHGLKWTYIFLYLLGEEIFERMYGLRVNKRKYLFYPGFNELSKLIEEIGFKIVSSREIYETDFIEGARIYRKEELYKSFSVAGLNVFLWELEELERERFREFFLRYCDFYDPPILGHRGFFAIRKPLDFIVLERKGKGNLLSFELREIEKFLEEVDEDFIPFLSVRSPDDIEFKIKDKKEKRSIRYYLDGLISSGYEFFLLRRRNKELIGLLAYKIRNTSVYKAGKSLYISTIAISKFYRGLGLSYKLYDEVMKIGQEMKMRGEIEYIETRTWSTNERVKKVLKKLGFRCVEIVENHRGEGVHTEYYIWGL